MKNYYKILNIEYISSNDEIKKAYRVLALRYHPDKTMGDKFLEEKFKEISEAYEILSDPFKRREYDIKYKQLYQKENNHQNTNKENITPSTFLLIFIDIKNKILQNIDGINREGLFRTLVEILTDDNIKFLANINEVRTNGQIIDHALFFCIFLNPSHSLTIKNKLIILANNNQNLVQKILSHKPASKTPNTTSSPNKSSPKSTPYNNSSNSSNIGCVFFIIVSIIAAIVIANSDKKTSNDFSQPSSIENGDLNNSFIQDSTSTRSSSTTNSNTYLTPEEKLEQEKSDLINDGWKESEIKNGHFPNCYNFIPRRGNVSNKLEVSVGGGTDVAIKLMDMETEKCVRYIFINSGSTYEITNIPEGIYYLKIAYGKEWYSKVENGQCIGKFIKNPLYEKGNNIMDFNVQRTYEGESIPSFQLQLDVISSENHTTFNSQNISENEFNN